MNDRNLAIAPSGVGEWHTRDGIPLGWHSWLPSHKPRAIAVAIHGMGGAGYDFEPLGEYLTTRDMGLHSFHLRGQGLDPEPKRRGDLENAELFFQDTIDFYREIARRHPDLPIFLAGESMGAVIAVHTALRLQAGNRPPAGLALFAPVVEIQGELKLWQRILFHVLFRLQPTRRFSPKAFMDPNAPPPRMTRDEEYQSAMEDAPHRIESFTLRFFREIGRMIQECGPAAANLRVPVGAWYAGNDLFIRPERVEAFCEQIPAPCQRFPYPESYHLLFRDFDAEQVMESVASWMEERMSSHPQP